MYTIKKLKNSSRYVLKHGEDIIAVCMDRNVARKFKRLLQLENMIWDKYGQDLATDQPISGADFMDDVLGCLK